MSSYFNVESLMEVCNRTVEDADGIFIPGELMPSGKPVRSAGVTKAALMADKGMAEGWYNAVRGAYERENEESNRAAVVDSLPDLVIGGDGGGEERDTPRPAAPEVNVPQAVPSIEEELQARSAKWEELMDRAKWEEAAASADFKEAKAEWLKCQKALDAIRGTE